MDASLQSLIDISHGDSFPYSGDFRVDDNVLAQFPDQTQILSANRSGTSAWTVTARLDLKLPDGSEQRVFLKSAPGSHGHVLMEGEFNAMSELYKWDPELVPKPLTYGRYAITEPEAYFFLSEYIDMKERMPDPDQLCAKLARLHKESQSPTGQYGFHITTCQGRAPQLVSWEKSWTTFFIKLLQHVIKLDFEYNGYWEELDIVEKRLISGVIPRLLDALVTNGRSIKPSLIHADLWEGNTGTAIGTNKVYIFDSAAFYAHNEMEIGDWRCHYNKIHNKMYTKTYQQHFSPSHPQDEWDDRNRLYSIYYNVIYSVNHLSHGKPVRQVAYNDMYYLIDKFAPFPEGEGPSKLEESEMAKLSDERDHTAEEKI
ncbi:Fructosamine kinase-domain-containing protein [Xylaria flabelliformis]|nr:Fructosamine kinase-domain-containing protein [Xylaria flabelliformis]